MSITPEDFERIVQEVIRRLLVMSGNRASGEKVSIDSSTASRQLAVDDRVVTLATLEGRLTGIGTVMVNRRAVVTPAVKDELKDRGIGLEVKS